MLDKYTIVAAFELNQKEYKEHEVLAQSGDIQRKFICSEHFEPLEGIPMRLKFICRRCNKEWRLTQLKESKLVNGRRQFPDGIIEVFDYIKRP